MVKKLDWFQNGSMEEQILEELHPRPTLTLYIWQWLVAPLVLLFLILGLFNYFEEPHRTLVSQLPPLSVSLEYPSQLRHMQSSRIKLNVTNQSRLELQTVTVHFAESYLQNLTRIQAQPEFEDPNTIDLGPLGPGETKSVRLKFDANKHGTSRGFVLLQYDKTFLPRIEFETVTSP